MNLRVAAYSTICQYCFEKTICHLGTIGPDRPNPDRNSSKIQFYAGSPKGPMTYAFTQEKFLLLLLLLLLRTPPLALTPKISL